MFSGILKQLVNPSKYFKIILYFSYSKVGEGTGLLVAAVHSSLAQASVLSDVNATISPTLLV